MQYNGIGPNKLHLILVSKPEVCATLVFCRRKTCSYSVGAGLGDAEHAPSCQSLGTTFREGRMWLDAAAAGG